MSRRGPLKEARSNALLTSGRPGERRPNGMLYSELEMLSGSAAQYRDAALLGATEPSKAARPITAASARTLSVFGMAVVLFGSSGARPRYPWRDRTPTPHYACGNRPCAPATSVDRDHTIAEVRRTFSAHFSTSTGSKWPFRCFPAAAHTSVPGPKYYGRSFRLMFSVS